jgi:hypothetical protein
MVLLADSAGNFVYPILIMGLYVEKMGSLI